MTGIRGLMAVLDTRSFASVWYWLLLGGLWTWLARGALGVPSELVRRVQGGAADRSVRMALLDWVSLAAPRWRIAPRDGVILTAAAAFALSSLAALGFLFDRQFAQALVLLVGPLSLLAALRLRLAGRLDRIVGAAGEGRLAPDAAAADAAAAIARHLRATMILSAVSVAAAAIWGTRWLALHPNGL